MIDTLLTLYANLVHLYDKLARANEEGNATRAADLERQISEASQQYDEACKNEWQ
jgi:hypothetical protein